VRCGKATSPGRKPFTRKVTSPITSKPAISTATVTPASPSANRASSDKVAVFRNLRGTFAFNGSYATDTVAKGETTADGIRDLLLHDLDCDGKLDLLAADHVSHKVIIWKEPGNPPSTRPSPPTGPSPFTGPRTLLPVGPRVAIGCFDTNELLWLP
jgi:hypothetical protein